MTDITNDGFISLSLFYAGQYERNGKNFINCFIKFQSVRSACEEIVKVYKKTGVFAECLEVSPDFTDYVSRLDISDRWRRVLGDTLQIIYSLVKR